MNDYSESIGWCCQHSAVVYYDGADHACRCPYLHEDRNHLIPVFAVIPEHLRPETHDETHECVEVVTLVLTGSGTAFNIEYRSAGAMLETAHYQDDLSIIDPKRINDLAEATARARR